MIIALHYQGGPCVMLEDVVIAGYSHMISTKENVILHDVPGMER